MPLAVGLVTDGLRRQRRLRPVGVQDVPGVPTPQGRETSLAVGAFELVGRRRVDAVGREDRASSPVPMAAAGAGLADQAWNIQ